MTTPIVASITDEQLAELEEYCEKKAFVCCGNLSVGGEYMGAQEMVCCGDPELTEVDINTPAEEILGLIARLRDAEKDAARYRWIREQHNDAMGCTWVSVYHPGGWVSLDTSVSGKKVASLDLDSAVDTAMEQSK